MPSAASSQKELRFALLSLFPSAGLKEVSEAAKVGDFDAAVEILRARVTGVTGVTGVTAISEVPALVAAESEIATAEGSQPETKEEEPVKTDKTGGCEEKEPEEDILTEALAAAKKDQCSEKKKVKQGGYSHDGWQIKCEVDISRTCQSLRTLCSQSKKVEEAAPTILRYVGDDNTAAFAAVCFERMIQREQEFDDRFCVFYHHYNGAALLYEVQTEIARYAFDLPDSFAPLPRVFLGHFKDCTLDRLKASFAACKGQDHDPWFRSLAISASPTLYAFGSEAPPLSCFRRGYGCTDLSFRNLTISVLQEACSISSGRAAGVVHQLSQVAARFGLQTSGYDSVQEKDAPQRLGGQMLQIFIAKDIVNQYVYRSKPFGISIETQLDLWLENPEALKDQLDGQVRILFDPAIFLDSSKGQLFHYCGDWEFLGGNVEMEDSRAAFVQELRRILGPVMKNGPKEALQKRLQKCRQR